MDFFFILFIIVGAVALLLIPVTLTARARSDSYEHNFLTNYGALVVTFGLTGLLLFLASFKVIGAKDIGVPVTFGKPSGAVMHNGWNWKNPASSVHVFDGALQTEKFSTDKDDAGEPIAVRLFIGSVATVNVTFQWRLDNDDNVKKVYLNYRNPENINTNLVKRALQQALNDAFSQYNPYSALIAAQASSNNTPGAQQVSTSFSDMQNQTLTRLTGELVPQGVTPVSLTLASINYDQKTQDNLDNLGQAITKTQIALQNEKTAAAQAAANELLNHSAATPATVQQYCIQVSEEVLKAGHNLPTGWNCFGGQSVGLAATK